jgi:hypothetical protein
VRISEGFFSGYHALVQEFIGKMKSSTASKRAKVALEYFGRMTTLECRQGRPIDCSASFSNPMMEGPWCRFRREARACERRRV